MKEGESSEITLAPRAMRPPFRRPSGPAVVDTHAGAKAAPGAPKDDREGASLVWIGGGVAVAGIGFGTVAGIVTLSKRAPSTSSARAPTSLLGARSLPAAPGRRSRRSRSSWVGQGPPQRWSGSSHRQQDQGRRRALAGRGRAAVARRPRFVLMKEDCMKYRRLLALLLTSLPLAAASSPASARTTPTTSRRASTAQPMDPARTRAPASTRQRARTCASSASARPAYRARRRGAAASCSPAFKTPPAATSSSAWRTANPPRPRAATSASRTFPARRPPSSCVTGVALCTVACSKGG